MAYLGSISYSVYLFQQLIIPSPFHQNIQMKWSFESAGYYLSLAMIFGAINYHLVEVPCLRYLRRKWNVAPTKLNLVGEGSHITQEDFFGSS